MLRQSTKWLSVTTRILITHCWMYSSADSIKNKNCFHKKMTQLITMALVQNEIINTCSIQTNNWNSSRDYTVSRNGFIKFDWFRKIMLPNLSNVHTRMMPNVISVGEQSVRLCFKIVSMQKHFMLNLMRTALLYGWAYGWMEWESDMRIVFDKLTVLWLVTANFLLCTISIVCYDQRKDAAQANTCTYV